MLPNYYTALEDNDEKHNKKNDINNNNNNNKPTAKKIPLSNKCISCCKDCFCSCIQLRRDLFKITLMFLVFVGLFVLSILNIIS